MEDYNQIDQLLHQLTQLLAKAGRNYLTARADDSHTNVGFNAQDQILASGLISTPAGPRHLALRLNPLQIEWIGESGETLQQFPVTGKTIAKLETELNANQAALGLPQKDFYAPLHFDIPEYASTGNPIPPINQARLLEWVKYRSWADEAAKHLLKILDQDAEVCIWPHHFDSGTYVKPNEAIGIGFGLAVEDAMVGAPYFYLAGHPTDAATYDYENVPALTNGTWKITEHWKGAVLPLPELTALSSEAAVRAIVQFQREALSFFSL